MRNLFLALAFAVSATPAVACECEVGTENRMHNDRQLAVMIDGDIYFPIDRYVRQDSTMAPVMVLEPLAPASDGWEATVEYKDWSEFSNAFHAAFSPHKGGELLLASR